jgi:hypothetical protein
MKRKDLSVMSVEQLVQRFASLALRQATALDMNDIATVNKLFGQLEAVGSALKEREGDRRDALLALYTHPSAQVRLKAVKATLAVAPEKAMKALRAIANSKEFPQAGKAGMSLWNIETGVFRPT